MISDELITSFFKNECTKEDRLRVIEFFSSHPERLNQYMDEEGWSNFMPDENVEPGVSQEMLNRIRDGIANRGAKRKTIRYLMAAASVIVLFVAAWSWFSTKAPVEKQPVVAVVPVPVIYRDITNRGDTVMAFALSDGSAIHLSPNSTVSFTDPIINDQKRSVYLKGKALFSVYKDKSHPFTVYSGELSTTALGTSFSIDDFVQNSTIKIRLFEGSVVVRYQKAPAESNSMQRYLKPGQELVYNKQNAIVSIRSFLSEGGKSKPLVAALDSADARSWYMFNNQSLPQVFDYLGKLYGVEIKYRRSELQNLFFIGKLEKTDTLQAILNDIALLNNLVITKIGSDYIVRRKPNH